MPKPPLDELYFEWLYGQVASLKAKNPRRTYWNLCRIIFRKEFVWFVPNDDNRIADGLDLRNEFLEERKIRRPDPHWMNLGCSMLEMMVALSRRMAFEADGDPPEWFWEMIDNLGLYDDFNDREDISTEYVEEVLDRVIWRQYEYNGTGGLFPLKNPRRNQKNIEIWYQFSAYLAERS